MKTTLSKSFFFLIFVSGALACSSNDSDPLPEPINCLNGGTLTANNTCNCPQGFSGDDCSNQLTPSSIDITSIIVKAFPNNRSNNDFWDALNPTSDDGLPDIYVTLQNASLTTIYDSPVFFENAISNGTANYTFTPDTSIRITNFDNPFLINIFDYDPNNDDDFMVGEPFFIFDAAERFPETITILNADKPILVDLILDYTF